MALSEVKATEAHGYKDCCKNKTKKKMVSPGLTHNSQPESYFLWRSSSSQNVKDKNFARKGCLKCVSREIKNYFSHSSF